MTAAGQEPAMRASTSALTHPTPERHRWLDQWLVPIGEPLLQIAAGMVDHLDGLEANTRPRQRKRRAEDQANFQEIVAALIANLAYAALNPPSTGRLAVHGGKRNRPLTRYDHKLLASKQVRPVLDLFHAAGFADFRLPPTRLGRGELSSIAPTPKLEALLRDSGVTFDDFGRRMNEEVVILTHWAGPSGNRHKVRVNYLDTPETDGIRAEVRAINDHLATADIVFLDDGRRPVVDPMNRTVRRFFNAEEGEREHFTRGGRLYGGFWQNMKAYRRRHIRIDGEPIADLDYKSMFARLAYAEVGVNPPEGDLYALPGLEGYRSGVKLAMNALFWDDARYRKTWPEEMGIGVGTDEDAKREPDGPAAAFSGRLPAGMERVADLKRAMLTKHPALDPAFGRDIGGRLMFRESEVLMAVLRELRGDGMVALPIHDGLMVARSKAQKAANVMRRMAHEMTGQSFPVEEKVGEDDVASAPSSYVDEEEYA